MGARRVVGSGHAVLIQGTRATANGGIGREGVAADVYIRVGGMRNIVISVSYTFLLSDYRKRAVRLNYVIDAFRLVSITAF